MIIVGITLLSLIIIILIVCDFSDFLNNRHTFPYSLGVIISMLLLAVLVATFIDIPAIEVYRGNTTLKITYRDSVAIDSVVVYKKK